MWTSCSVGCCLYFEMNDASDDDGHCSELVPGFHYCSNYDFSCWSLMDLLHWRSHSCDWASGVSCPRYPRPQSPHRQNSDSFNVAVECDGAKSWALTNWKSFWTTVVAKGLKLRRLKSSLHYRFRQLRNLEFNNLQCLHRYYSNSLRFLAFKWRKVLSLVTETSHLSLQS